MKKVMKLFDPHTGLMQCRVCGSSHAANIKSGGGYYRGAWQCRFGCKLPDQIFGVKLADLTTSPHFQ